MTGRVSHMPSHVYRRLIQHRAEVKRLIPMEDRILSANRPDLDTSLATVQDAIARRIDAERCIIEEWSA
jgi:hypothetical protein